MKSIPLADLRECASQVGLSIVAVTDADDLELDRERLERWQESGYAADMSFMRREAALLSGPRRILASARTILSVGAYYDRAPRTPLPVGYGRVARYAWGRDYHKVLRKRLEMLCALVGERVGHLEYRVFSDSVPLLERAIARKAGLGFVGKNTMLIVPRAGSFLFLGEILWNLEVTSLSSLTTVTSARCGTCSRCLTQCPTQAFVSERVLDAGKCISYLTIEKREALSWEERSWLGDWIFGCDVCQEVCPFNTVSLRAQRGPDLEEFSPQRGVGQGISLQEVLGIQDDKGFTARFAGTPLMRTKRAGLLRNAAVVAANTGAAALLPDLRRVAVEDSSAIVRQHALWAYCVLARVEDGTRGAVERLLNVARKDPAEAVRAEANQCVDTLA